MNVFQSAWLGVTVASGLIAGFGPQNMFVLRQGILLRDLWLVAGICTLCDMVLSSIGVLAAGRELVSLGLNLQICSTAGAAVLAFWGGRSFLSALGSSCLEIGATDHADDRSPVASAFIFSLLNPYVYFDTVAVLGTIGASLEMRNRWAFLIGTNLVSALWFFGLTYFGKQLAKVGKCSLKTKVLDIALGLLCFGSAIQVLFLDTASRRGF